MGRGGFLVYKTEPPYTVFTPSQQSNNFVAMTTITRILTIISLTISCERLYLLHSVAPACIGRIGRASARNIRAGYGVA